MPEIDSDTVFAEHMKDPEFVREYELLKEKRIQELEKRLELAEAVCEEAWDCYTSGIWREFSLRLLDRWKAHKNKEG